MKNLRILFLIGCLACLGVSLTPKAKGDEWRHETIITFSGPVEVPGVALPAGTYVFRLLDNLNNNVVQVLSEDEQKVYATFMTMPDYITDDIDIPGHALIIFRKQVADAPQAIKEWFFAGSRYGQKFVYPKTEVHVLAKAGY